MKNSYNFTTKSQITQLKVGQKISQKDTDQLMHWKTPSTIRQQKCTSQLRPDPCAWATVQGQHCGPQAFLTAVSPMANWLRTLSSLPTSWDLSMTKWTKWNYVTGRAKPASLLLSAH